ncbi:hypothetical protein EV122DRAFT_222106 [Schizophyllum commune]
MPDSPSLPSSSSAGTRPLRYRLLPSWLARYLLRSRASTTAASACSAAAFSSSTPDPSTAGVEASPDGNPTPPSPVSIPATCAAASPSPSAGGRHGLLQRLSLASIFRRLSRNTGPSSGGSPPVPVRPPLATSESDIRRTPPTLATVDADPAPPANSDSPPPVADPPEIGVATVDVVCAPTDDSDATDDVPTTLNDTPDAPLDVADAPDDDPMATLWNEAVAEWQQKTGFDLTDPGAIPLASKEAVLSYIAKMGNGEDESEKGQWEMLRERVDPLARILEKLCDPVGDTISAAFPPGRIIFAAVGLIVSAYTRTREDFAQINDAFSEMQFHLQVVETVADSHPGNVLHDSCVHLLTQVLAVLGVITEMQREGCLRKSIPRITPIILSQARPLSEALQTLRLLADKQQKAIAGATLARVTQLMENIAANKVTQDWMCACLVDVLRATRNMHDLGLSTQAEVMTHRAALRRMDLVLYKQLTKLRGIEVFVECEQIKGWLNYVDPSYRLRKLLDDRAEGTCSWFLDSDDFAALKEGKTKAVLLSGKAGSGKSTIIATAVEALRAHCAGDPRSLVLIHVFDSTNSSSGQRNLHSLLSTLICQLALNDAHCASIISKSRKAIVANGLPTKVRMEELFLETIKAASLHAIVVVDALDEASDEDEIISFLRRLEAVSAISVLASRRPFTDLTHSLGSVVAMDKHGENNDIGLLLDTAMSQAGDLARVQVDRNGVREKLLAGAEGK